MADRVVVDSDEPAESVGGGDLLRNDLEYSIVDNTVDCNIHNDRNNYTNMVHILRYIVLVQVLFEADSKHSILVLIYQE